MTALTPHTALVLREEKPPIRIDADGAARIGNTRVTLDTLITAHRDGAGAEEIARLYPTVLLADVYAVLAYYLRHQVEVDAYLEQREREARQLQDKIEAEFSPIGLRERLLKRRRKG